MGVVGIIGRDFIPKSIFVVRVDRNVGQIDFAHERVARRAVVSNAAAAKGRLNRVGSVLHGVRGGGAGGSGVGESCWACWSAETRHGEDWNSAGQRVEKLTTAIYVDHVAVSIGFGPRTGLGRNYHSS